MRFTVQGDDEAETAEGLRMLLSLGLQKKLPPTDMISNGWMARAIPKPILAAEEPDGA